MGDAVVGVVAVVAVGLVMAGLGAVARRARRRGTAGAAFAAAMAAYDEAVHTSAHETFVDMRTQDERTVPRAVPSQP